MFFLPFLVKWSKNLFYMKNSVICFELFLDHSDLDQTIESRFLYFFCNFLIVKKNWKKYCAILLVFGSCTQNFMSLWWFCAEKWLVKVEHVLGGVHRVHCTQNGIVHWLTQPHTLPKLGTVHSWCLVQSYFWNLQ